MDQEKLWKDRRKKALAE
jgi:hypothetical protein